MSTIREIKTLQAQGWSVSAIAPAVHVDRKTVRKDLQPTDFSPPPPTTAPRPAKLDSYKATIDRWLADDASQWFKQRHTAQRIYDRLRAEYPACDASYATVRRYVRQQRHPAPTTGPLALVWHPGEAQVAFGQAAERRGRAHYLCRTFPYSNAGYLQLFRGEHAECVVHGLVTVCTHLGGAPRRLVFDNASGVGHRRGDTVHLTELFQRCQAHYGFETTFCTPAAGYEKGNVENKVGYLRRNLLVPPPQVADWETTNRALLRHSEQHWTRPHYQKGQPVVTLFADDRAALRALPPQPFAPYRFTRGRTDRQGRFRLEGAHWYSSAPELAEQALIVRVGAHTVEPLGPTGPGVTGHARAYGPAPAEATDYRTTVHRVAQQPGAWRTSGLREDLPAAVRAHLEAAVRADLQAALRGLAQSTERGGFDHAVRALEAACTRGRTSTADVVAVAGRLALAPGLATQPGPNLQVYDALLPPGVAR